MRRRLFLLAAPAIVAAPSLMRVSAAHVPLRGGYWIYDTVTISRDVTYSVGFKWVPSTIEIGQLLNITGITDAMRGQPT